MYVDQAKTSSFIQLALRCQGGEKNQPELCQYGEDQNASDVLFQRAYFY